MRLVIGVLAHNEAGYIGATLRSLLTQDALADPKIGATIIVVANGCADATAAIAEAELRKGVAAARYSFRVAEIARPGKSNAWNTLIHKESPADTDIFVVMDADIEFTSPNVINRLIAFLDEEPQVMIAADQPVKRFAASGGLLRPLIRALQKTGSDDDHALSGQLYAARGAWLRQVRMPIGLLVEDGYLRAMTLTRNFTEPEMLHCLRRAPNASHYYRPYERLGAIWRYERRQAVGTAINRFVYDEFRDWRAKGLQIPSEVTRRNEHQDGWLEALIAERAKAGAFILVPRNYVLRRLRRRRTWTPKNLLKTPLIAAGVVFDLAIAIAASSQLRRRSEPARRWDAIRAG